PDGDRTRHPPHPRPGRHRPPDRNLGRPGRTQPVMDLEDTGCAVKYLIRDRDGKYPAMFDAVLADAGIKVVLTGIRVPRMNAIMERWVRTCRRELLDRTLIWNQRHLVHVPREFEDFYNAHRPHQGIANARPLCALPTPLADPGEI